MANKEQNCKTFRYIEDTYSKVLPKRDTLGIFSKRGPGNNMRFLPRIQRQIPISTRSVLFSPFFRDFVVVFPDLFINSARAIVVGGLSMQLVILPNADPFVTVGEI